MNFSVLVDCNEWIVNPPPTAISPTLFKVVVKRWQWTIWPHREMAYVEISLLTGFKFLITSDIFHHFYVVSPLPFCNYLDPVMVLIRNIVQSTVESFPELLHAVATSASVWGAGSVQVLELTPGSPVSTCTRWPPSLRSAVLLNPRAYFQAPLQSHWESQFLGRLISPGVPKKRGVWNSHGGRKDKRFIFFLCIHSVQFSSVAQSCPTLYNPMNRSTPGLPVHHQLPESSQTHVHWVGDAIQPYHPLLSHSPPSFNLPQHQGLFKWVSSSY